LALPLQPALLRITQGEVHVEAGWKILVADRNRHVREFLRRELEAEGYEVQVARDGREVRDLLNGSVPPDLLVLDLEIPYLEELAEQAHFQDQNPPVPLIIHSFGEDSPSLAQMAGAAAFLEKTEDPARLKELVAEVLAKYYPGRFLGQQA